MPPGTAPASRISTSWPRRAKMVGGGQSARPRADDQDSLAGAGGRWFEHPAALAGKVAEEPLHRMDRYRAVEMRSVADGFTRVIAHPAVDCGEWVVRDELTPGRLRAGRRWRAQARPGCSPRRGNRHCTAAADRRRRVGAHAPARPEAARATGPRSGVRSSKVRPRADRTRRRSSSRHELFFHSGGPGGWS